MWSTESAAEYPMRISKKDTADHCVRLEVARVVEIFIW
jgi:hypothetical protein